MISFGSRALEELALHRSSVLPFSGLGVWLGYARLFRILFRSAFS